MFGGVSGGGVFGGGGGVGDCDCAVGGCVVLYWVFDNRIQKPSLGHHQPNIWAKGQTRTCDIYIYIYMCVYI